jgi:hypothetical protein
VTSGEFSEVDFDLLADYVGGALHGTPADGTVADLVAADPVWRAAHDELTAALTRVGVGMRALAATDEPMPDDVATRLSAALSAAPAPDRRADPLAAPATPVDDTAPGRRHLSAVPAPVVGVDDEPAPGPAGPRLTAGNRWRRWRPRPAVIAAAATVVAVAAVGVGALQQAEDGISGVSTTAGDAPAVAPAPERDDAGAKRQNADKAAAGVPADRVVVSGTGYQREQLADQVRGFPWAANDAQVGPSPATAVGPPPPVRPLGTRQVPAGLERLTAQTALRACLDAITAAHRRLISAVELVDFATLEGAPALVVSFVDVDRARWVWVSGPACGDGAAGPDTLFVTRVG